MYYSILRRADKEIMTGDLRPGEEEYKTDETRSDRSDSRDRVAPAEH